LADLRRTPLVSSRGFGKISYRDVLIINGEFAPADANEIGTPDAVAVKAAFLECEESELRTVTQAVHESIAHLAAITTQLNNCIGEQLAPNLKPLASTLDGIGRLLKEKMVQRGVDQPAAAINGTPATLVVLESSLSTAAVSGEITNREDVVRAIDRLCAYYERCEPSSPVPLLLRRARRLVSKSFFEILHDLAPDGVPRAEMIFGAEQSEGGS
jgi:type VI secretion system protein ImpA